MQVARNMLYKDLDLATYLRTVNKVKGIVQCALDDKQRLMLKFSQQRMIAGTTRKQEAAKPRESVISTANLIYEKFAESGLKRSD